MPIDWSRGMVPQGGHLPEWGWLIQPELVPPAEIEEP